MGWSVVKSESSLRLSRTQAWFGPNSGWNLSTVRLGLFRSHHGDGPKSDCGCSESGRVDSDSGLGWFGQAGVVRSQAGVIWSQVVFSCESDLGLF